MVAQFEGRRAAGDECYALVVSRFNELVTQRLLDGALETLRRHGVADDRITVVHVPGACEIPLAADRLARTGRFAAICCLGAVIQGETDHHEYVNRQVSDGIARVGASAGIPVTFGVLTCRNVQQALDRAGGKKGNKGSEAVLAALEMVDLLRQLDSQFDSRTDNA